MIRDVRGLGPDVLEFTSSGGDVLRVVADGVGSDERMRVRERLLEWLRGAGVRVVEGTRS
jgi:hypothetical protein